MILFNVGCFILIFSNFIISLLPNKEVVKSSNDPELVKQFLWLLTVINLSLLLAVISGMIGGYIYLIPLLFSSNEDWIALISPGLFVILFMIAFIRIHYKLKGKN